MSNDYFITELFPVPLYQAHIEVPGINEQEWEWTENLNNQISVDQHVLDHEKFSKLRDDINSNLQTYWRDVMSAGCDADPHITHSWFNVTYSGQSHHLHRHPNSYISGVLFWQYHDSAIMFTNDRYHQIEYETSCETRLNSNVWHVKPEPGLLLLFPSHQSHSVKGVADGDVARLSLSFDTWLRGDLNSIPNQKLTIG